MWTRAESCAQRRIGSRPRTSAYVKAAAAGRADVLGLQRAVGNAGVTSVMEEERFPGLDVVGSVAGAAGQRNAR